MNQDQIAALIAESGRYFTRKVASTGHRKYRRCRAQSGNPGAFGAGSKPMRASAPVADLRFMSRAQRAAIGFERPTVAALAKAAGRRRTRRLKAVQRWNRNFA